MTATGTIEVTVPDIGDFADVPVIEILVAAGDTVALDDPLITLESDKATMDVPAPAAGKVAEVLVSVGDRVSEGTAIARLEGAPEPESAQSSGEPTPESEIAPEPKSTRASDEPTPEREVAPASPAGGSPRDERQPELPSASPPAPGGGGHIYASPSVRRAARERGIDLSSVRGTGRKGRITRQDLEQAANGGPASGAPGTAGGATVPGLDLAPWPKLDFSRFGETERVPRSRIQRISAPNLARNWVMIPHVTHHDEADITDLEAWRKELNAEYAREDVKLTMVGFLVAACVATLKAFPDFNASLDGDELIIKHFHNIGFAADTPQGLVVPVIRDAGGKGLIEIARELAALSKKAREGKLAPADIQGSTFTISSLGGIGGTAFTPIVNAPEVAILGVTRSAIKPVWDGSAFAPRMMLPLSLSYDHRVIDGAAAARFTTHLAKTLTDLRRVLL